MMDTGPVLTQDESMSREMMERYLQLAAYNRADLLKLVRPLAPAVRKWQADPDTMSINQVLRHVATTEQWYVSRVVDEERLPLEWDDDLETPLFKFLAWERETAVACLRQLTDEQLNQVVYRGSPAQPSHRWTVHRVLRRILEHEREHIEHTREILGLWRLHTLARLAAERAYLLQQLWGLDEETLSTSPVSHDQAAIPWTAKDLLAHIGFWDAFQSERMSKVMDGRIEETQSTGGKAGMAVRNAELYTQYKDMPLELALAVCLKERSGFLATVARIADVDLHRPIQMPWGWRTSMQVWLGWRHKHDADHARELARWRKKLPPEIRRLRSGPKFVLRALLKATRKALVTLVALAPEAERTTRPVCGVWTLKDLVGHLTDWEKVGVYGLQQVVAGYTPEFEKPITDFDVFNAAHAAARQEQPWEQVWAEFQVTRQTLLNLLDDLSEEALARSFATPWGTTITSYRWVSIWSHHEHEHTVDVRRALRLPGLPKRLMG